MLIRIAPTDQLRRSFTALLHGFGCRRKEFAVSHYLFVLAILAGPLTMFIMRGGHGHVAAMGREEVDNDCHAERF